MPRALGNCILNVLRMLRCQEIKIRSLQNILSRAASLPSQDLVEYIPRAVMIEALPNTKFKD
jgi:hypothetical protein